MSKPRIADPTPPPQDRLTVPLGSLRVTGSRGFTLTGEELAHLVSLAQECGFRALVDQDSVNMELRGLAELVRALGMAEGSSVNEEFAFVLIERTCAFLAARLEAGPAVVRDYVVTIDRKAVA